MANVISIGEQNGVPTVQIECDSWGWVGDHVQTKNFIVGGQRAMEEFIQGLVENVGEEFEIVDVSFGVSAGIEQVTQAEIDAALAELEDNNGDEGTAAAESGLDGDQPSDQEDAQGSGEEDLGGESGSAEEQGDSGGAGLDSDAGSNDSALGQTEDQVQEGSVVATEEELAAELADLLADNFDESLAPSASILIADGPNIEVIDKDGKISYKVSYEVANGYDQEAVIYRQVGSRSTSKVVKGGKSTKGNVKIAPGEQFTLSFGEVDGTDIYSLIETNFETLAG